MVMSGSPRRPGAWVVSVLIVVLSPGGIAEPEFYRRLDARRHEGTPQDGAMANSPDQDTLGFLDPRHYSGHDVDVETGSWEPSATHELRPRAPEVAFIAKALPEPVVTSAEQPAFGALSASHD